MGKQTPERPLKTHAADEAAHRARRQRREPKRPRKHGHGREEKEVHKTLTRTHGHKKNNPRAPQPTNQPTRTNPSDQAGEHTGGARPRTTPNPPRKNHPNPHNRTPTLPRKKQATRKKAQPPPRQTPGNQPQPRKNKTQPKEHDALGKHTRKADPQTNNKEHQANPKLTDTN
jgi:hypothetical protein